MSHESTSTPELLIVITGEEPEKLFRRIEERCYISQRISNRVFLVRRALADISTLKGEGTHVYSNSDIPEEILNALDEKETLFVSAWQMRFNPSKKRLGDGLAWDAPGFKPPH